jgi:hypothetical protein
LPEAAAVVALENLGESYFLFDPGILEERLADADGILTQDVDGDRDPDLRVWSAKQGLRTFLCSGPENQNWIALHLRAPKGKVPLDAKGVTVEVFAGGGSRQYQVRRPNIVAGLGGASPSLVSATWPNGITEYLFDPAANAAHTIKLVMRLEGSCPFLYVRDGDSFRFVTDLLGLSPLGMLVAPGVYAEPDPEEYLRLPDWVAPQNGRLEMSITEELREVTYLDQVEVVVVDAPAEVTVQNGEQWTRPPVKGLALRLLGPLAAPASVRDDRDRDVSDIVARLDHRYLTNFEERTRHQGTVALHRLTIELPPELARDGPPAIVLTGWLHWGNTSTNVARAQDRRQEDVFPFLEIPDGKGGWQPAGAAGLPAGKTKPVVLIPTKLDRDDPRVRLTTTFEVYWDRIAVARVLSPETTEHRVHRLAARDASLRFGGFSRWFRPAPNGPYLFDYAERRDYPWRDTGSGEIALAWHELEGLYTPYGAVTPLLGAADDRVVVFGSGEEVLLSFDTGGLPALPPRWRRTYFLHLEGWEKDGDFNVAFSQTVEPFPFRTMKGYPPSGPGARRGANRPSRHVSRDRLHARVRAAR